MAGIGRCTLGQEPSGGVYVSHTLHSLPNTMAIRDQDNLMPYFISKTTASSFLGVISVISRQVRLVQRPRYLVF